jgi:DNA-binding NtrC family response regulator
VPQAVEAIQLGADDYLTKPVSLEQLRASALKVLQSKRAGSAETITSKCEIIGSSPAMIAAVERARHAARTSADILIESESGTGKELFARLIHESSPRSAKPFVAVNCAALPEHLLESELFGHVRGAFTGAIGNKRGKFEEADGGTLLLDEIGEMPLALQPKLLRAIQEREFSRLGGTGSVKVDLRIIATTNVSLGKMVSEGKFRADLYYRLNVIPLRLPPLRERRQDIPELATFFCRQFARKMRRSAPMLSDDFLQEIMQHPWPGNVRELENFIHRVVALATTSVIGSEWCEGILQHASSVAPSPVSPTRSFCQPGTSIRQLERELLEATLVATDGNRTRAAEILGVSLRTVRNKIREYGLPPRKFAGAQRCL